MSAKEKKPEPTDRECLYRCGSKKVGTHEYHVYPSSASCLQVQLPPGVVCDNCNQYFSELENYFVQRHPGSHSRLLLVPKTRKGKPPIFEAVPGTATRIDEKDGNRLTYPLTRVEYEILANGNIVIRGYVNRRPFDSRIISRVLVKMAFESLYKFRPGSGLEPIAPRFDSMRYYARQGKGNFVWFAWRETSEGQRAPEFVYIKDDGNPPVALLCRLSLPGVVYLVPVPPFPDPSAIPNALRDWETVSMSGTYQLEPLKLEANFVRLEDGDQKP